MDGGACVFRQSRKPALGVGEDMDQTIEWTQDRGRGRVAGHASRVGEHLGRHRTQSTGAADLEVPNANSCLPPWLWLPCVCAVQ